MSIGRRGTRPSAGEWIRLAWYAPLLLIPRAKASHDVEADVDKWTSMPGIRLSFPNRWALLELLATYREFRTLFFYRLRRANGVTRALGILAGFVWPGERTLFLACDDIGAGLFIQHGFATIIVARHVGTGCWINQQVTIGWRESGEARVPWIGNGVHIAAGAKVLGDIEIGDGALIGANAVVLTDVPAGHTAVGVPARVIPPRCDRS